MAPKEEVNNNMKSATTTTTTTTTTWDGQGQFTQLDFMENDTVLVLNNRDEIVGSASKKDSHVFSLQQPHAILHRAFSVFIFDRSDGRLLLQQRAASKITFPSVWTNTCCSHPLHGMEPSEVDHPAAVAAGNPIGVKHAAIRKLYQELGIALDTFTVDDFKFLTRLHYWAADTVTHGKNAPWGEHEIEYVLFVTINNKKDLTVVPHPDEVDAVQWVNAQELQRMLLDETLLFSPWFRLIVQKWLYTWWKNLDETMTTKKHCDYVNIHEFDPPCEHFGGQGNAQALFLANNNNNLLLPGDSTKKQGAYGRLKTHKESTLSQLLHFDEVFAAISLLYINPLHSNLHSEHVRRQFHQNAQQQDDLAFCDEILVKVSRSFAAVIQQLPATMLVDVLIFYLVLRALDTIEDDTKAFAADDNGDNNNGKDTKVELLLNFHKHALTDPSWSLDGVGEGEERRLLQEFPKCCRVYSALSAESRAVISDITQRMAAGMAEFVDKDLGQGTQDVEQYNRYCHFVAGLVGEGLSRLFAVSGLEDASFGKEVKLSDQMGLFLQKTNIIRDYLEDYVDKRAFWPRTIWSKYSLTGDLGYFANQVDETVQAMSLQCLNELVTDALELVPDCLEYLSKLKCLEIFRFCAIPQVMAIATLDKCFNNVDVFTGVVKIRKGLSCKLIVRTNNLLQVHETFHQFAQSILDKARREKEKGTVDPAYERTVKICTTILSLTQNGANQQRQARAKRRLVGAGFLLAAALVPYVMPSSSSQRNHRLESSSKTKTAIQVGLTTMAIVAPWLVSRWTTSSSVPSLSSTSLQSSKDIK